MPGTDRLLFVCRVPSEGWSFAGNPEIENAPAALALLWLQVNRARLRATWTEA
jgi:hypothetical protein